jgi:TetR/AcrR family transcriptional regulator, transcriptional repressor of aconitase
LQFGYAKTSIDDVAKEACLSRPLIYLIFKNKMDLYKGVIDYLLEGRFEEAEKIIHSNKTIKTKLINIYEILLLGPWEQITGKPMSADFYKMCTSLSHEVGGNYKDKILKCTQLILLDRKISEIFVLAVEGLKSDLPDATTLRNRLFIFIDNFLH